MITSKVRIQKLRFRKLPKHKLVEGCPTCDLISTGGMFVDAECVDHCKESEDDGNYQLIEKIVRDELRTVNVAIRVFASLCLICLLAIPFGLPLFIAGFGTVMSLGNLLIFLWWEKKIGSYYSDFL